ncbi:hypothetical protein PGT21_007572 [Puccinia graminis f. sp. tritici]|uniref:Uncharacterized protein n=1 Tax=Puccinia graminis f. sp. tritici TaxID=56615 RepID=A0A5B0MEG3_PUCGR|nr:hypothetical protein PGT21_007572 [Puccinia graminis f. sp. tritici]
MGSFFLKLYLNSLFLLTDQALINKKFSTQEENEMAFLVPDLNLPLSEEASLVSLLPLPPSQHLHIFGKDCVSHQKQVEIHPTISAKDSLSMIGSSISSKRKNESLDTEPIMNKKYILEDKRQKDISKSLELAQDENLGGDQKYCHKNAINLKQEENGSMLLNTHSPTICALELNNGKYKLLDFENWTFIQLDPQEEASKRSQITSEKPPTEKLLECLYQVIYPRRKNEMIKKNEKNPISIPRDNPIGILSRFLRHRNKIPYPTESDYNGRIQSMTKVILKLAKNKIGLDRCIAFNKEMQDLLTLNLNSEIKTYQNQNIESKNIPKMILLIEKLNKVVTVLILIHVSLFKEEGEQFRITEDFIKGVLEFLGSFWREIAQGTQELIGKEEWSQNLHDVFTFKKKIFNYKNKDKPYNMWSLSFNIVKYWAYKTDRVVASEASNNKDYQYAISEIINKMIFYLNYQYIIKNKGKKNNHE